MFINTITKTILLPQNANMVRVMIWNTEPEFNNETGIETYVLSKHESLINMALISQLTETTLEACHNHYERTDSSKDYSKMRYDSESSRTGWGFNKKCKREVTESVKVLRVTKLHNDINLYAFFITIL